MTRVIPRLNGGWRKRQNAKQKGSTSFYFVEQYCRPAFLPGPDVVRIIFVSHLSQLLTTTIRSQRLAHFLRCIMKNSRGITENSDKESTLHTCSYPGQAKALQFVAFRVHCCWKGCGVSESTIVL